MLTVQSSVRSSTGEDISFSCSIIVSGSVFPSSDSGIIPVSSIVEFSLTSWLVTVIFTFPMTYFIGFMAFLITLIVSVVRYVRKHIAERISVATSPGGPIRFSIFMTHINPWFPPGLKASSPMKGVSIFENVMLLHIMIIIIQKNHFHRFTL